MPEKPLCVFDETGRLLGQIITGYTRHHVLVDWTGDGNKEIGSALPRSLFDGRGERIVTFGIGGDHLKFDTSFGVFIPKGVTHGPLIWHEFRKPHIEMAIMLGAGTLKEGWGLDITEMNRRREERQKT